MGSMGSMGSMGKVAASPPFLRGDARRPADSRSPIFDEQLDLFHRK